MRSISLKKFIVQTLLVASVFVFIFFIVRAFYYAPNDEVSLSPEALEQLSGGAIQALTAKPVKLEIPAIGVDARVQHVGVTKKGNMAAPNNFVDAGWYKYGTIPGNRGSAVIAGHVNNGVSFPAVFYNLKELKTGDEIFVTNEEGGRLRFLVTGREEYDFNASADEVFTDDSGKLLKLITCTGVFVEKYRTHNKRLVITAELSE